MVFIIKTLKSIKDANLIKKINDLNKYLKKIDIKGVTNMAVEVCIQK